DAVVIMPAGAKRGKDGIREAFTQLIADLPDAAFTAKSQVYGDNVLLVAWTADTAESRADDGVDTFVFQDGLIRVQTVYYTLQRKGGPGRGRPKPPATRSPDAYFLVVRP